MVERVSTGSPSALCGVFLSLLGSAAYGDGVVAGGGPVVGLLAALDGWRLQLLQRWWVDVDRVVDVLAPSVWWMLWVAVGGAHGGVGWLRVEMLLWWRMVWISGWAVSVGLVELTFTRR
ncbi:hypothetical protein QQ045_003127 [Rhodiola kirilowii]